MMILNVVLQLFRDRLSHKLFDLSMATDLGRHSKAVSPPHHLNFLSRQGVSMLLARCGLDEVEFSTPGTLDVDIVANTLRDDPEIIVGQFEKWLSVYSSEAVKNSFQELLVAQKLSSHMWVWARKPY